jgi:hypothetical protein
MCKQWITASYLVLFMASYFCHLWVVYFISFMCCVRYGYNIFLCYRNIVCVPLHPKASIIYINTHIYIGRITMAVKSPRSLSLLDSAVWHNLPRMTAYKRFCRSIPTYVFLCVMFLTIFTLNFCFYTTNNSIYKDVYSYYYKLLFGIIILLCWKRTIIQNMPKHLEVENQ